MKAFRFLCCLLGVVPATRAADIVVLLHGLGRSPLSMTRLARRLHHDGYQVHNLAYPSQRADIRTLANATLGRVFAEAPVDARIHLVTHSLGGILVRQYLHDHGTPASLGRVVMLAPPNAGSELVDRLRHWSFYRRINGPAGLQLGTDTASIPQTLGAPPSGVEIGIIAGNVSLNPFFSAFIEGLDDGKVSVARSHLEGESAHIIVPYSHTWMMWRRPVLTHIRFFLRTGRFTPSAAA
jgi:pimeloyl-ACP methyl ester carboxylesterase